MGSLIVSIFQYISNKMQRHTAYLYLETALHVSGGTSTHHQERIQQYLQHLVFVTPLLLPAVIVEEFETGMSQTGFQLFHDSCYGEGTEKIITLYDKCLSCDGKHVEKQWDNSKNQITTVIIRIVNK